MSLVLTLLASSLGSRKEVCASFSEQRVSYMLTCYPDDWVVTVDEHFQYGQKNKAGEDRWLVLHNKNNKIFQVRTFLHLSENRETVILSSTVS